jgi:hypothetical protein
MFTGLSRIYFNRLLFKTGRYFCWGNDKTNFKEMIEESNNNPFYNSAAANLKKELNNMQEEIKTWQNDFKKKNGRKPTLEEMQKDPEVSQILKNLDNQRKSIQAATQRFRIN